MTDEADKLLQLKQLQEKCKAQDDQKQALITGLFAHVDLLLQELEDTKRDLVDKQELSNVRHERISKAEDTIKSLIHEKERQAFAVVLVDGDCMPFKDELIKCVVEGGRQAIHTLTQAAKNELIKGVIEGGRQAAHNLIQAAKDLLAGSAAGSRLPHTQVVVRVYANLKGLAKTYTDLEILPDPSLLYEFVRGFNMVDALCDFVDAGNGKECSDEKVKGMFRLNLDDVHCQQILFGGSADNGYARLLTPYVENRAVCSRITLLKGPPFATELQEIKDHFHVASFNVFRRDKLPTVKCRVSFHVTPPATPSVDYARVAAKSPAPGPLVELVSRPPALGPASASGRAGATNAITVVKFNRLGQRVDQPLEYSPTDFTSLKTRKLCNEFHLLGNCRYDKCTHEHGKRLEPSKRQALRAVARLSPCKFGGLDCKDPKCLSGHRCTRWDCTSASNCRFPSNMHHVDIVIV